MLRRTSLFLGALFLASCGLAPHLYAQCVSNPCTVTQQVGVTVPPIVSLSLSASSFALSQPTPADFTGVVGVVTEGSGPTLTVRSNKSYALTVTALSAIWTPGRGLILGYLKPAGDLEIKLGSGSFVPASVLGATLSALSGPTTGATAALIYRTTYLFTTDRPDSYALSLRYTINAP